MSYKPIILYPSEYKTFKDLKIGDTFIYNEKFKGKQLFQKGEFLSDKSYMKIAAWNLQEGKQVLFDGDSIVTPVKTSIKIEY